MVQRLFNHYSTARQDMIAETTHFLDWALNASAPLPRIPRIRVDSGRRFSDRMKRAFWDSVFSRMDGLTVDREK